MNYLTHDGKEVAIVVGGWRSSDIKIYPYNRSGSLEFVGHLAFWAYKTANEMKFLYWSMNKR